MAKKRNKLNAHLWELQNKLRTVYTTRYEAIINVNEAYPCKLKRKHISVNYMKRLVAK